MFSVRGLFSFLFCIFVSLLEQSVEMSQSPPLPPSLAFVHLFIGPNLVKSHKRLTAVFQIKGLLSVCEAGSFVSSEILPKSGLTWDTAVLTAALSFKISPRRLQEIRYRGLGHLFDFLPAVFDSLKLKSRRTLNKLRPTSSRLKHMQMKAGIAAGQNIHS